MLNATRRRSKASAQERRHKECAEGSNNGGHHPDLEILEEANLLGQQHEQSAAAAGAAAGRAPHPVDVLFRVIGWVILYDPVHSRYIQPPRSHVCAQEDALLCLRISHEQVLSYTITITLLMCPRLDSCCRFQVDSLTANEWPCWHQNGVMRDSEGIIACLAEVEEGAGATLLLLLAMDVLDRDVNVIQ